MHLGFVWRRGARLCRGPAGPNDHALRDWQNDAGPNIQGTRQAEPGAFLVEEDIYLYIDR
jgi:hypothetical protein